MKKLFILFVFLTSCSYNLNNIQDKTDTNQYQCLDKISLGNSNYIMKSNCTYCSSFHREVSYWAEHTQGVNITWTQLIGSPDVCKDEVYFTQTFPAQEKVQHVVSSEVKPQSLNYLYTLSAINIGVVIGLFVGIRAILSKLIEFRNRQNELDIKIDVVQDSVCRNTNNNRDLLIGTLSLGMDNIYKNIHTKLSTIEDKIESKAILDIVNKADE